jgi:Flp pilus assembly protein CpaB
MFLRLLVVFSLILSAAGLGILGLQLLAPPPPQTEVARVESAPVVAPAPQVRMLVAARPLSIGTLLKDEDFREQDVPADAVPDGAFVGGAESRAELRGALLRRQSHEPVLAVGKSCMRHGLCRKIRRPARSRRRTGVLREVGPRHAA